MNQKTLNFATKITEKDFRQQVISLAKLLGYKTYFTWTSIHSPKGIPDLILCRPPRLIFAELKSEQGKVTPHQQEWLDLFGECPGVEKYLWKPSQFEEIVSILRGN